MFLNMYIFSTLGQVRQGMEGRGDKFNGKKQYLVFFN